MSGLFDLNGRFYRPPWPSPPAVGRTPALLPGLPDGTYQAVIRRSGTRDGLTAELEGRTLVLEGPLGCD